MTFTPYPHLLTSRPPRFNGRRHMNGNGRWNVHSLMFFISSNLLSCVTGERERIHCISHPIKLNGWWFLFLNQTWKILRISRISCFQVGSISVESLRNRPYLCNFSVLITYTGHSHDNFDDLNSFFWLKTDYTEKVVPSRIRNNTEYLQLQITKNCSLFFHLLPRILRQYLQKIRAWLNIAIYPFHIVTVLPSVLPSQGLSGERMTSVDLTLSRVYGICGTQYLQCT